MDRQGPFLPAAVVAWHYDGCINALEHHRANGIAHIVGPVLWPALLLTLIGSTMTDMRCQRNAIKWGTLCVLTCQLVDDLFMLPGGVG